jgi:hypothetical protein
MWGQEKSWPFCVLLLFWGTAGEERCVQEFISDERLLAGGGCVAGGCAPAKPLRSEVIIFWDVLLRRKCSSPEEKDASPLVGGGPAGDNYFKCSR